MTQKRSSKKPSKPKTFLGLELSGAKNDKTTLAVLQFFPQEKKIFLLDVIENLGATSDKSADTYLIETLKANMTPFTLIGTHVPLELPPCFQCSSTSCKRKNECQSPYVKTMEDLAKKAKRSFKKDKSSVPRVRDFTPYTQRPVELYLRYQIIPKLPKRIQFETDETLGGTKAPLTARMQYLQRFIQEAPFIETLPKLTLAALGIKHKIQPRLLRTYRHLEQGAFSRRKITEILSEEFPIFIYEKDFQKLSKSLSAFDAFLSALTALLSDLGKCQPSPKSFPKESGWVYFPKF